MNRQADWQEILVFLGYTALLIDDPLHMRWEQMVLNVVQDHADDNARLLYDHRCTA